MLIMSRYHCSAEGGEDSSEGGEGAGSKEGEETSLGPST